MPLGLSRLLAFIHPVAALMVISFLAYVAALGLRSRNRGEGHLRPRHARLAPWAYGLMVVNAMGGALSSWWLRPDLGVARGAHFRFALMIVVLLSGTAWLSRHLRNDTARLLHPLLGLIVLLLAGLQVFFGMAMLPG